MRKFEIHLTEPQYEVLKEVARTSGHTEQEYLHSEILESMEANIDVYYGNSKAIKHELLKKVQIVREELER